MSACRHPRVRAIRRVILRAPRTYFGAAYITCTSCGGVKVPHSPWWKGPPPGKHYRAGTASELLMPALTGRRRVSIAKSRCMIDLRERPVSIGQVANDARS